MPEAHRIIEDEHTESKHRVLGELGQGGTALVELAVAQGPSGFNKLIVRKSLKRHLAQEPQFRSMFLSEARLAARLNHPNIVQTYEVVEEHGLPVIVMEYLEGETLSSILLRSGSGGPFTRSMHLRVITDTLAGLHYAHDLTDYDGTPLGVVHRDISPHNIFVTFAGQAKILDFGIAKLGASLVETQTGVIKGKIRYMAPEQLAGEGVDRRADIFSVGVMLWEAAVGSRMWQGLSDTQIMNRILNSEFVAPRKVAPSVPVALDHLVMKALAPNRDERYRTAAELEVALEQVLSELEPATIRDAGRVVSVLFDEERKKTQALIEAQLSKAAALSFADYTATQPPLMATTNPTVSTTTSGPKLRALARSERTRKRALWLGLASVTLIGSLLFARDEPHDNPEPRVASAPAREAPAARNITVRFSALPRKAKIYLDNVPLPSNPHIKDMRPKSVRHIVRAEAEGYQTSSAAVVLDDDEDVMLILERKKEEPKAEEGAQKTKPPAAPRKKLKPKIPAKASVPSLASSAPAPVPAPSPNCTPPYYFDDQRIKHFKPECM